MQLVARVSHSIFGLYTRLGIFHAQPASLIDPHNYTAPLPPPSGNLLPGMYKGAQVAPFASQLAMVLRERQLVDGLKEFYVEVLLNEQAVRDLSSLHCE